MSSRYITPELNSYLVVAERGYIGSMLEDPFEQPEQGW